MPKLTDRLVEAANRVGQAWRQWGPVDEGRPKGEEFDAALLALRLAAQRTQSQTSAERAVLGDIVRAADEFPEPIHFRLRQAIEAARNVIVDSDRIMEE